MGLSAATPFTIDSNGNPAIGAAKISSTSAIVLYRDGVAGAFEARVVESDETVNTAETVDSNPITGSNKADICVLSSTLAAYACASSDAGGTFYVGLITISGTSLSHEAGSVISVTDLTDSSESAVLITLSSSAFILVAVESGSAIASYFTVSGTTITEESQVTFDGSLTSISGAALSSTKALVAYSDSDDSDIFKMCVLSISGSTISAGTPVNVEASDVGVGGVNDTALAPIDSSKCLLVYANFTDTATEAVVVTVSGTTPSAGTPATVVSSVPTLLSLAALSSSDFVLVYNDQMAQINVSGSTATPATPSTYTTDTPTANVVAALSGSLALAVYDGSTKGAIITYTAFSGYDLVRSSGGQSKNAIAVMGDGDNLFLALEDDATGNQIVLQITRPSSPTVSIAYAPGGGSAANVVASADPDRVVFFGNFATDVGVVDHRVAAGSNTDATPSTIGSDVISQVAIDPADADHLVAINKTDEDALESTDDGANWSTLNATLGIQVVAMALAFFGQYWPIGGYIGGNDGTDENASYTPNAFNNLREDSDATLDAAGAITGIDISLDYD